MSETRIDPAKGRPHAFDQTAYAPCAPRPRSSISRARPSIARTGLMRLVSSAAMRLAPGDRAGGRGFRPSIERPGSRPRSVPRVQVIGARLAASRRSASRRSPYGFCVRRDAPGLVPSINPPRGLHASPAPAIDRPASPLGLDDAPPGPTWPTGHKIAPLVSVSF